MMDRSVFSLVVNDDVSHEWLGRVVDAMDAGLYSAANRKEHRIPYNGIIEPQTLVHEGRGSMMPRISFVDHCWNTADDDPLEKVRPDFTDDSVSDDPLIAMARDCLTAPWMDRGDKKRHHPVLLALAAVSARGVPQTRPIIGACAPSPWDGATSYEAESMIGGGIVRTPTDPDVAALVPRLVSITLVGGTYGNGPNIVLTPYGYRMPRDRMPDTVEILRILSKA